MKTRILGGIALLAVIAATLYGLVGVPPDEREGMPVVRVEELDRAAPEGRMPLAQGDEPLHPPEERMRVRMLGLDVDGLVVVLGVDDDRQVELLAVRR